tara:strand:+ start:129 stop:413 length:285 start_codon:yes stop_codon:yes gene_type:complete
MIKLLNPNQMTGIAYKERGKHEHPDLMEKLTKMLKMPVDTKKMNRNFSCHTKTVCTKINPLQKIKSKTLKKGKKGKKRGKTRKRKEEGWLSGFF